MNTQKPLQFKAGALDYFILTIVSLILAYIPFVGWTILLNYSGSWVADRLLVNEKKVVYKAGFGESFKLVFIGTLLLIITVGIYSFWFVPKLYAYVADHVSYEDAAIVAPAPLTAEPVVAPEVTPVFPQTPPTNPIS